MAATTGAGWSKTARNAAEHRGKKAVGVGGSPVEDRAQVDARRETGTRPCEDDRPFDAAHGGDRVVDELEIKCVHGRIVDSDGCHAVGEFCVHHGYLPPPFLGFLHHRRRVATGLLALVVGVFGCRQRAFGILQSSARIVATQPRGREV